MEHEYHLDWSALHDREIPGWSPATHPAEVCVTPGHDEHTRGDAWLAEAMPHFGALEFVDVPPLPTAPGQLAVWA